MYSATVGGGIQLSSLGYYSYSVVRATITGLFCFTLVTYFSYILARDSISALCYRNSVCPSVTRVDQSKTVEVMIMQFSPHSSPSPILLVFSEISFIQKC